MIHSHEYRKLCTDLDERRKKLIRWNPRRIYLAHWPTMIIFCKGYGQSLRWYSRCSDWQVGMNHPVEYRARVYIYLPLHTLFINKMVWNSIHFYYISTIEPAFSRDHESWRPPNQLFTCFWMCNCNVYKFCYNFFVYNFVVAHFSNACGHFCCLYNTHHIPTQLATGHYK